MPPPNNGEDSNESNTKDEFDEDNPLNDRIRRLKISRIKKNKSSPEMKERVLGKSSNKYETLIAGSGTPVSYNILWKEY